MHKFIRHWTTRFDPEQVVAFESADHNTRVHLASGTTLLISGHTDRFEESLADAEALEPTQRRLLDLGAEIEDAGRHVRDLENAAAQLRSEVSYLIEQRDQLQAWVSQRKAEAARLGLSVVEGPDGALSLAQGGELSEPPPKKNGLLSFLG